jgi:acid phosphatase family membrane protein YuiD
MGSPTRSVLVLICLSWAGHQAMAGCALSAIDHKLAYDGSGIWKRSNQVALLDAMLVTNLGGALWEGGETRLGKTYWQSIDSVVISAVSTQALKFSFTRKRPSQTDNPCDFFQGGSFESFPSGEVSAVTAIVTPFVLEYGKDQPAVYALELLPIYDAAARMKVQAHWQTDVLAAFAVGTGAGYYAHSREQPFILNILPHGAEVGVHYRW